MNAVIAIIITMILSKINYDSDLRRKTEVSISSKAVLLTCCLATCHDCRYIYPIRFL